MTTDIPIIGSTPGTNTDRRGQSIQIWTRLFLGQVSFDDMSPGDFKRISLIPWFDGTVVLADSDVELSSLAHYSSEKESFWGLRTDSLASRVWKNIIAVDDVDLTNFGIVDVKRTHHVGGVANGLLTFAGGPLVFDNVDVDLWRTGCIVSAHMSPICARSQRSNHPRSAGAIWCTRMRYVGTVPY